MMRFVHLVTVSWALAMNSGFLNCLLFYIRRREFADWLSDPFFKVGNSGGFRSGKCLANYFAENHMESTSSGRLPSHAGTIIVVARGLGSHSGMGMGQLIGNEAAVYDDGGSIPDWLRLPPGNSL
jgi:hypothetical protein